jgi:hypothetical protein
MVHQVGFHCKHQNTVHIKLTQLATCWSRCWKLVHDLQLLFTLHKWLKTLWSYCVKIADTAHCVYVCYSWESVWPYNNLTIGHHHTHSSTTPLEKPLSQHSMHLSTTVTLFGFIWNNFVAMSTDHYDAPIAWDKHLKGTCFWLQPNVLSLLKENWEITIAF